LDAVPDTTNILYKSQHNYKRTNSLKFILVFLALWQTNMFSLLVNLHRWGLVKSAVCECSKQPTTNH